MIDFTQVKYSEEPLNSYLTEVRATLSVTGHVTLSEVTRKTDARSLEEAQKHARFLVWRHLYADILEEMTVLESLCLRTLPQEHLAQARARFEVLRYKLESP